MRRALRGTAAAIMNLRRALKKSTQLTSNARRTSVSDATASDGGAGGGAGRVLPCLGVEVLHDVVAEGAEPAVEGAVGRPVVALKVLVVGVVELVGLEVTNLQGEILGTVSGLLETGANDVLVVQPNARSCDQRERLIPYLVGSVVKQVSVSDVSLVVDWAIDYLS